MMKFLLSARLLSSSFSFSVSSQYVSLRLIRGTANEPNKHEQCSFVKKYICSRTVHEHLPNGILCLFLFVKEMNLFVFVCVCLLILGNER
ncbi:hypothetical protein HanIR_Chr13g0643701 [Helianthus annuus]|nr:hypothetical protein HanIR_Chr13g0643701 [Helianthus annuus]